MTRRPYISRLTLTDGIIIIGHAERGRTLWLRDLWHRARFFAWFLRKERRAYSSPLSLIKSSLAAATTARTFDIKLRQLHTTSAESNWSAVTLTKTNE